MRLLAALVAALPIGHSVDGRAIVPVVLGTPGAPHRVLVVGCIHGNEPAGIAIVKQLIRAGAPAGTEIVAVTSVNPDGCRRGTRQNAHGVDLNRNFPSNWSRIGRKGSFQWAGPSPLSEPESRYAVKLIEQLQPEVTIWFHQHEGLRARVGREHPDRTPVRASRRLSLPERQVAVRHRVELAEPPVPRDGVVRRGAARRRRSDRPGRRLGACDPRDRPAGSRPLTPRFRHVAEGPAP